MTFRSLFALCTCAILAACSPSPTPSSSSSAVPSGSVATNAPPPGPRPLRGEPPGGSPRRRDPKWQRALGGDPLNLYSLAEAEGAEGLLEGLEDGGDLAHIACEALPLADNREIALGRLAEVAVLDDTSAVSYDALIAIHRIAASPPSRGEPLDPDGVALAAKTVMAHTSKTTLSSERRARAISAARAFAERGVLDAANIPTDLDPPSPP